jgi:hypothetical protein
MTAYASQGMHHGAARMASNVATIVAVPTSGIARRRSSFEKIAI